MGDQAVLASFADEASALGWAAQVREAGLGWVVDIVPAYMSVGVFYDADQVDAATVDRHLRQITPRLDSPGSIGRTHVIPVCYEHQLDLERVAQTTGLSPDEVITLHSGTDYTVYAIGFVPGFPYLGYLPGPLQGVGRLPTPRVRVEPGSVGLTGKQTGVYPLARPGGWNLIGRTPLTLVDVKDGYFPLQVGDRVRFTRIDEAEYQRLLGERLA